MRTGKETGTEADEDRQGDRDRQRQAKTDRRQRQTEADGTLISASAAPHCGAASTEKKIGRSF